MGTYNTIKATIAEVKKAKGSCESSPSRYTKAIIQSLAVSTSILALSSSKHDLGADLPPTDIAISATLHYRGSVMQAHVSAAKAGIDALMNVVAVEYGPAGVRANVSARSDASARLFADLDSTCRLSHQDLSKVPRESLD